MTPHPETGPLSAREERALREIAQHLTRTDPDLLEPAPRRRAPRGRRLLLGALLVACAVLAVAAATLGPIVALGLGFGFVVTGSTLLGLQGRHQAHRCGDDAGR